MEKCISSGIPYLINSKTGTYIPLCSYVDENGRMCEKKLRKVRKVGERLYQRCADHMPKRSTKRYCEHLGCETGSGRYRYCYNHDIDRQNARQTRIDEKRYPNWLKGVDDLEAAFDKEFCEDN